MNEARTIATAIQKMAGKFKDDPVELIWGDVVSVDEKAGTCNVRIKNDVEVPDVALQAAVCDGLLLLPVVDSTVVLLKSVNGPYAIVILTSDLDKIYWQVGDASITVWSSTQNNGQSTQFNDGTFGGLLKLVDPNNSDAGVLARLNKIEDDNNKLRNLLSSLLSSVVNEPGNGAPSAFQAALHAGLSSWLSPALVKTQRADLENKLITHGK